MLTLSESQIREFEELGFTVIRHAAYGAILERIRLAAEQQLEEHSHPLELEADVHYPGAPESRDAPGGETERRLLQAWERDQAFRDWALSPTVSLAVGQLLDCEELKLNLNHHNCIMTKHPAFSSDTLWHRDTRYWGFQNDRLVNAWLALGEETEENGGMQVLPGSHVWDIHNNELDDAQFLRTDLAANRERIATAAQLDLGPGDLLLFSANIFHAAGRNRSAAIKYSLVFTYHGPDTQPAAGTRSSSLPEISVPGTR
jgi:phytanoyl-CoA hydroxylase